MIFKLKKTYLIISPYFFILPVWAIITSKTTVFMLCFTGLILHELGHIAMIYMLKERIAVFSVLPFGFSCRLYNQKYVKPKNMIKILASGPATNIIVAGLFFLWTENFATANFIIGIINLIPLGEMDGGRLIKFL